jgi:hypothetical protein
VIAGAILLGLAVVAAALTGGIRWAQEERRGFEVIVGQGERSDARSGGMSAYNVGGNAAGGVLTLGGWSMIWAKALGVWGVVLVVMVCNGAVRDALLKGRLGEQAANQVSVVTGCTLIVSITFLLWRWMGIRTIAMAWGVGVLWILLTVAFEFGFMHYVAGASWDKLWSEYNVMRGRLWPVVMVVTLMAPRVVGWWRGF